MAVPIEKIRQAFPDYVFETVIDCGAHHGETTAEILRHCDPADLHAFEPVPSSLTVLRDMGVRDSRIRVVPKALGERNQSTSMFIRGGRPGNRLTKSKAINPRQTRDGFVRSGGFEMVRLDDYCDEAGVCSISFLKIDVEGHELRVLRGAKRMLGKTDFVQAEVSLNKYNAYHADFCDVRSFLERRGFHLFLILNQTLEWGGNKPRVLRRADAVWVNGAVIGEFGNVRDR